MPQFCLTVGPVLKDVAIVSVACSCLLIYRFSRMELVPVMTVLSLQAELWYM